MIVVRDTALASSQSSYFIPNAGSCSYSASGPEHPHQLAQVSREGIVQAAQRCMGTASAAIGGHYSMDAQ